MNPIQWFPGHMAKAIREMRATLDLCDAVLCVLDARAPASSYNPALSELAGVKPVLFVWNKGDLADGGADVLLSKMREKGRSAVKIAANAPASVRPLKDAMAEAVAEKAKRYAEKGTTHPFRFLVAGIPNTGKSTVINLLAGKRKANVGDKAGVTRSKQWVKCGAFELLDTPGVMPPSCENQTFALRLACLGCLNDDILHFDELALALLAELKKSYPMSLNERYGIEGGEPLEMLDRLCARRGFVLRGNGFDYERGERALIDDLRKGRLGKICFDSAADLSAAGLL